MTENKVNKHIDDDSERVLTEEDIEGGVTLGELLLEAAYEEIEKRILYGSGE